MTDTHMCPDDEALIGYVEGSVAAAERAAIEHHLATCNACVETIRCVHTRLHAVGDALLPPPQSVSMRVEAILRTPARRVPILLRLPILVPVSLAAGVMLTVGMHSLFAPAQPVVLKRAAQMQRTTHAIPVLAQPSAQADVIAQVNSGQMVEVRTEHAGWCRIALPAGDEGWVECSALE